MIQLSQNLGMSNIASISFLRLDVAILPYLHFSFKTLILRINISDYIIQPMMDGFLQTHIMQVLPG